jgi:hypothetical protein
VLALVLLAASVAGALLWAAALSPLGLVRLAALPGQERQVTINRPGTYLVFEEDPGASDGQLPPPFEISVLYEQSGTVPVTMLVDAGEVGAPFAYDVFPHEGRAIARFEAVREGAYYVRVERLEAGAFDPSDYSDDPPDGLAVGRQLEWSWLRTPLGLLLLGGVPLAAGIAVIIVSRRRRRGVRTPTEPPRPSGSLPVHG